MLWSRSLAWGSRCLFRMLTTVSVHYPSVSGAHPHHVGGGVIGSLENTTRGCARVLEVLKSSQYHGVCVCVVGPRSGMCAGVATFFCMQLFCMHVNFAHRPTRMQSTAVKVDHGSWTSWLARVTGLTSDRGRRFNDLCGTAEAWDVPSGRWAVRVASGQLIKVRPENLVLLREHRSTVEPATAAEARELLSATSASVASSGGDCAFGEYALPAEVALLYIFPLLTRHTVKVQRICSGEIEAASAVCHEWRGVCLALRALTPACARDIKVKLLLEGHQVEVADGEYRIWQWGERTHPPLTLFCRNLLSTRPTEFLSLANEGTNLSYFPCGGAALGTVLVSSFRKLRICPWTLTVKTDDYTYATSGGHLLQTYWNGQRRLEFFEVPYATARDAAGHAHSATSLSRNRGQAQIDLRGTGLAVDTGEFMSVGCASFGRVCVPTESCAEPKTRVQQRVALYGGGYAGRMAP